MEIENEVIVQYHRWKKTLVISYFDPIAAAAAAASFEMDVDSNLATTYYCCQTNLTLIISRPICCTFYL